MKRILVGMSGGVDSSAAALVLKNQGYSVAGATLLLCPWSNEDSADVRDAKAVCEKLCIEHYCVDGKALFEQKVIEYFCDEYLRGRTPNPCVECNRHIKFGLLLDWALDKGFDAVATGHYVRRQESPGGVSLLRSLGGKDQSYALWRLDQRQLAHAVFPLCDMEKQQLREMVKEAGLPVFSKQDSQDVCFIPDGDYCSFIKKRYPPDAIRKYIEPGAFVDRNGNRLGRHEGLIRYTNGQRRGLGGGFAEPMFVLGLKPESNEIVLGKASECFTDHAGCGQINLIEPDRDGISFDCGVKIRYSAKTAQAHVQITGDCASISFAEPQRAVTPGQSAVFYDNERVIGGGIIN